MEVVVFISLKENSLNYPTQRFHPYIGADGGIIEFFLVLQLGVIALLFRRKIIEYCCWSPHTPSPFEKVKQLEGRQSAPKHEPRYSLNTV